MKCKIGDLAIVIHAQGPGNLGKIVQVIASHDGIGELAFRNHGPVWIVSCEHRLTWYSNGKRYRRKIGPVPDNRLQPIRGVAPDRRSHLTVDIPAPAGKSLIPEPERSIETADV